MNVQGKSDGTKSNLFGAGYSDASAASSEQRQRNKETTVGFGRRRYPYDGQAVQFPLHFWRPPKYPHRI
jgi:hypothetical protein